MRRIHGRPDEGTTLTELMMVVLVLGIVVITTSALAIGFTRTNAENVSRQDQIDVARTAVERMSKTLRTAVKPSQLVASCTACTADAFIRAENFSIQFYGNLDNANNLRGPSRISYTLATTGPDAGTVIEKVQRPDSATPSATGYVYCNAEAIGASATCKSRLSTQRLAAGALADTGFPMFEYFDSTGAKMTTATSGLTAEQLQQVLSIELRVTVLSTNSTKPKPTTYIQRILLPNSHAVLRPGVDT